MLKFLAESDLDNKDNGVPISTSFFQFLSKDPKGPNLNPSTIHLLAKGGVMDGTMLLAYSQQPFCNMLLSLSANNLKNLSASNLATIKIFGNYVHQYDIITMTDSSDFSAIDPGMLLVFLWSQCWKTRLAVKKPWTLNSNLRLSKPNRHARPVLALYTYPGDLTTMLSLAGSHQGADYTFLAHGGRQHGQTAYSSSHPKP